MAFSVKNVDTGREERNPARLAGMLCRSVGLDVDESEVERLAAFCDEPVGELDTRAQTIVDALWDLCRAASGVGMQVWVKNGAIHVQPNDPLANMAVRETR